VCYGGELGPDLGNVAERCGMGAAEAAALHAGGDYLVYAIGFTPGVPLPRGPAFRAAYAEARHAAAEGSRGSVGIGGAQTGVYPLESPGGWQIIGRTPLALFRPGGIRRRS
jgi:inhibitor of KinA